MISIRSPGADCGFKVSLKQWNSEASVMSTWMLELCNGVSGLLIAALPSNFPLGCPAHNATAPVRKKTKHPLRRNCGQSSIRLHYPAIDRDYRAAAKNPQSLSCASAGADSPSRNETTAAAVMV